MRHDIPAPGELRERDYEPKDRCDTQAQTSGALRAMSADEVVAEFFKYQPPNSTTIPKYAAINQAAKNFAEVVLANCPNGADRADAIRKIREARMTANASIALNGLSLY